ncbi:hypothetical protein [Streptomyces sp. NBC_01235]|uniref:hypothetical protein n=1 Tax=Streptomyces sp. NBC_01235 TaxID=2903788 RepID=UPI002E139140|nr:hypothetical protein OG289_46705 [Streptomyces sp. NBC_01235]
MSQRDDLTKAIGELSDTEAVQALTVLLEDRGLLSPARDMPATDEELRGAVDAAAAAEYLPPGQPPLSEGDLARVALEYVAALEDWRGVVGEAVEYVSSSIDRFDPVVVPVGVLVVTLLQTEVVVKRDPRGRWSLTVHKRALRDAALGRLLAALLSHFTSGK